MFKKAIAVLTTYSFKIFFINLRIYVRNINSLTLTSLKVLIDNSIIFPAVNFIVELDIAMIKMQPSFFFPVNRYQSIIYVISPTFLHYFKIFIFINSYCHSVVFCVKNLLKYDCMYLFSN